jgi:hypothetical protein
LNQIVDFDIALQTKLAAFDQMLNIFRIKNDHLTAQRGVVRTVKKRESQRVDVFEQIRADGNGCATRINIGQKEENQRGAFECVVQESKCLVRMHFVIGKFVQKLLFTGLLVLDDV